MTRIITVAAGLAATGRTQLGINLAVELVRKGHSVGLYHDDNGHMSVNRLLQLSRQATPKGPPGNSEVVCHGYQGVDVISSRFPLSSWNSLDPDHLAVMLTAHESWSGYDDLLIDSSGMSPRGMIACCMLSTAVVLVVTPDRQSQAETFAVMKILHLNEFNKPLLLVVNKAHAATDVHGIHARLDEMAGKYLGQDIALLGSVQLDKQVVSAQALHQAFTSVFPESAASCDVVRLVEAITRNHAPDISAAGSLPGFWSALVGEMRKPVRLAGKADLADFDHEETVPPAVEPVAADAATGESTLLRYEGPFARLDNVMESFSAVMHVMADDMLAFYDRLLDLYDSQAESGETAADANSLERRLAGILKVLKQSTSHRQQVSIQVEETPVSEQHSDWLKAGHYIKYVLLLPAADATTDKISREMERIPGLRHSKGQDSECVCEALSVDRDACLSVVRTPQGEIRIHYWHTPEAAARLSVSPADRQLADNHGNDQGGIPKRLH